MSNKVEKNQDIADAFCQDEKYLDKVVYIENIDSFALYNEAEGYFKVQTESSFEKYIHKYVKSTVNKSITAGMVRDVITQIKWTIYRQIPDTMTPYISFDDKVLNLETFEFQEKSIERMAFYRIRCPSELVIGGKIETPIWQKFLDDVIVTPSHEPDKNLQAVIQEMFGYYLLNTTEGHVMFFLVGDGQNGKSVMLDVLKEIIGREFLSAMSIETLTTNRFAIADLAGKKINVCGEEESVYIRGDRFKALVSGDEVHAERKNQRGFTMKPSTKFIFATNERPTFSSLNQGLLRRVIIVPFNKTIPEAQKDTKLFSKIITELPGIVQWTLEGAKRLVENGFRFTYSEQIRDQKNEFEKSISSALRFLDENFIEEEGSHVTYDELYTEYKVWCENRGKKALNYDNFNKDISRKLTLQSVVIWSGTHGKSVRARQLKPKPLTV